VHKRLNLDFGRQMKDFFVPNILFFAFIAIFYFFRVYINPWIYAPLFFICNLTFLKILKHESYDLIQSTFNSITQKIPKFKR